MGQARQQAKDLTKTARRRVNSQESYDRKIEKEKTLDERYKANNEEIDGQPKYEQCILPASAAHDLASSQAQCEALHLERENLRTDIARTRGAFAEEKLKAEKCIQKEKFLASVGRKQLLRNMEDLRSRLVSHYPPVKSTCSGPKKAIVKKKPVLSDCEKMSDESDNSDVTWPPRTTKVFLEPIPHSRVRFYDHNTRVSKECPKPPYSVKHVYPSDQPDMSEAIAEEEEAYVRKENLDVLARRENMIRGYRALRKEMDKREADRIIKDIEELEKRRVIQQAVYGPCPSDCHRQTDVRKMQSERFVEELSNEIECEQTSTKEKHTLPQNTTKTLLTKPAPESRDTSFQRVFNPEHCEAYADEADCKELLGDLIKKVQEERTRRQENRENRFGAQDFVAIPSWVPQEKLLEQPMIDNPESTCARGQQNQDDKRQRRSLDGYFSTKSSSNRSQEGVRQRRSLEGNLGNKSITGEASLKDMGSFRQRFNDMQKCNCSEKCNCYPAKIVPQTGNEISSNVEWSPSQSTKRKNSLHKVLIDEDEFLPNDFMGVERSREPSPDVIRTTTQISRIHKEETTSSSTDSTSQADSVHSSITYEGLKVVVKVCDRSSKKKKSKSPVKYCMDKDVQTSLQDSPSKYVDWNSQLTNEIHTGSTSYMSPPVKLSPANEYSLRYILSKLEKEKKDPKLQTFINKLLTKSPESITNLSVSSVNDFSIASSVSEPIPGNRKKEQNTKQDVSCQVDSSFDSSHNEEVLKFSEAFNDHLKEFQTLVGKLNDLHFLPGPRGTIDDTSYLNPPEELCHSFKMSESVQPGVYPAPLDVSEFPTSIRPHPDFFQRPSTSNCNGTRREVISDKRQDHPDLSTIKESQATIEKSRVATPKMFDPDLSSIKGSPKKRETKESLNDSATSSLGILNDKDLSFFNESSSDNFEDIFLKLGIDWALATARKTRESRKLSGSSSSNNRAQYSHSTPLGLSPVKHCPCNETSTSANHKTSSVKSQRLTDTKKLIPPNYSLNIPSLSQSPRSKNSS